MNNKEQLNKLIDEALNSVDDIRRAEPRPFLLTRIQAKRNSGVESAWEKAGWFIARPAVAFAGLCMIIAINAMVIMFNRPSGSATVSEQPAQAQTDEFSYTVATIYDFENTQP